MLDKHEVPGSNPGWPTSESRGNSRKDGGFFLLPPILHLPRWLDPHACEISRRRETRGALCSLLARPANSPIGSWNDGYSANVESAIRRLREELQSLESRRERVWRLDETHQLADRDLEERMSFLNERKRAVESKLVALFEERTHVDSLAQHDTNVANLRQNAYAEFTAGDFQKKNIIARAVSASFGGMRVGMDGRILTGPKPDHVWLRKKRKSEI